MIRINNLVPEIYKESRDFRVFLKLLDIVVNTCKYDIDEWTSLYDPLLCKKEFLPLLADFIGYRYDNNLSVTENRIIMSEFNTMIKNKGSEIGLRLAAALSMNAQLMNDPTSEAYIRAVSQLQFLEMFYDYERGIIRIYYSEDLTKVRDLFKYVRPVGSFLELIETKFPEPESSLALGMTATVNKRKFTAFDYTDNAINKLNINLAQINRGDTSDKNNFGISMNNYKPIKLNVNIREDGESAVGTIIYDANSLAHLKKVLHNAYKSSDKSVEETEFKYKYTEEDCVSWLDLNCDNEISYYEINTLRKILLKLISIDYTSLAKKLKNPKFFNSTKIFNNYKQYKDSEV